VIRLGKVKSLLLSLLLLLAVGCAAQSANFSFVEVRYSLSGGVAGFDRTIRIAPDGSYRLTEAGRGEQTGKLSASALRGLKRLLSEVDWAELKGSYRDPKVVDSLDQTVAVRTARAEYITTVGTGGEPPPAVAALLTYLSSIAKP
jgi:hypothetical protein